MKYKVKMIENSKLNYWGTCVDVNYDSDFPLNFLIDLDEQGERVSFIEFNKKVNIPKELFTKLKDKEVEYILLDNLAAIYDIEDDIHYLFW